MSIALKKLELSNFRKHKKMEFSPAGLGITSISAPNGFGKSTIVDSLSWVLFGTKPAGVSKASELINWDADVKTDKIFVRAILQIDDGLMKVERKIISKTGSVECRVWWIDDESSDWPGYSDSVAGPGVSHAEPYIKRRIRMDEAGFLTAVLVQQKQVDTLISARPKERAEVIERMTGIEAISKALMEARAEQNVLKRQSQASEVDEDELEELKESYKKTISKGKRLYSEWKKLKEEKDEQESLLNEVKTRLSDEEEKSEESKELKNEILRLEVEIESKEENLSSVSKDKNEAKKRLPQDDGLRSVDDIREDLNRIEKDYISSRLSSENTKRMIDENKARISKIDEQISDISQKFSNPSEDLKKAELRESRAEKAILSSERGMIESDTQIIRLEKAISTLVNDHGECPTCLQTVSDLESTVSILESQKSEIEANRKKLESRLSNAKKAIESSSSIIQELSEFSKLQKERVNLMERIPELSEEFKNFSSDEIVLSKKKSILEKELGRAENLEEYRRRYETLLNRAQSLLKDIEGKKRRKIDREKKMFSLKVMSDRELSSLRRKSDTAQSKFQSINEKFIDVRNEMRLVKKDSEHLSQNIERMEKDVEKHKRLLEAVEIAATSTQVIDEFRSNRMDTTLPALEVYASDLLSRFTDGKLIELKLDSKFNATVKNSDGISCPVGLLSAGELSAAALALRIAISMLFYNGGDQSLIILDEVLVSQDSMRVDLILDTIKEVCQGQVVIIAHNAGISSIADKIVDLTDTNDGEED